MVVNLDEGNANIVAVLFRERVLLFETQEVMPERDCLRKIGDEVPDMRNTGDVRTRRTSFLSKEGGREQQYNRQTSQE
jgi:hypothetical protein